MNIKEIDYKKIGFKAGLEIHQQLNTGKLFCSCPSILRNDSPIFEVKRVLHKVPGESGEIDLAARYQAQLEKEFIYQGHDTTCLVELDEEPPHELNKDALYIALQIAEVLNCKIIPISQVMRKTVIDGSNTSGFQRTVMYARDGYVETSRGKVKIDFILLEEDACRRVKEEGNKVYWNLDRLGIPLVEVVTAPDIKDAKHAKETALLIGDLLRSCNVRRGIGTIRQDINISISGSNRVEIKGFQDPKIMELCVNNEILRQKGLIEISKRIPEIVFDKIKVFDLNVSIDWMKNSVEKGARFIGVKLKGYKGILGEELFSNYRIGTELSGYIKTRGFGGIIHGDEDLERKYKFSTKEINKIKEVFDLKENDSFIMVLGDVLLAENMFKEILFPRILKLKEINPKEVRMCLPDGTTSFLRPMPGSARMYPETDLDLLRISRDLINDVKKNVPESKKELEKNLVKQGLNEDMINILFKENKLNEFKEIVLAVGMPKVVGKILFLLPREISVKGKKSLEEIYNILTTDKFIFILEKLKANEIEQSDLKEILEKILEGVSLEEACNIKRIDLSEIEEYIFKIIKEKPGLRENAYMGLVMKEFSGKIDPKSVMTLIKNFI